MNRKPSGPNERKILWLGGSPCSGKSSIADVLGGRHGLIVYHVDDYYQEHLQRADPRLEPQMCRARSMTWNEVWNRPVEDAVTDEVEFYREEFALILDDLAALPSDRTILAEGAGLTPECVEPFLLSRHDAIWVVPTADFQLHHYSRRDWIQDILAQCDDPDSAFANWMGRDIGFARRITSEAADLGFQVLVVDGSKSIEEYADVVERQLRLTKANTHRR